MVDAKICDFSGAVYAPVAAEGQEFVVCRRDEGGGLVPLDLCPRIYGFVERALRSAQKKKQKKVLAVSKNAAVSKESKRRLNPKNNGHYVGKLSRLQWLHKRRGELQSGEGLSKSGALKRAHAEWKEKHGPTKGGVQEGLY